MFISLLLSKQNIEATNAREFYSSVVKYILQNKVENK